MALKKRVKKKGNAEEKQLSQLTELTEEMGLLAFPSVSNGELRSFLSDLLVTRKTMERYMLDKFKISSGDYIGEKINQAEKFLDGYPSSSKAESDVTKKKKRVSRRG